MEQIKGYINVYFIPDFRCIARGVGVCRNTPRFSEQCIPSSVAMFACTGKRISKFLAHHCQVYTKLKKKRHMSYGLYVNKKKQQMLQELPNITMPLKTKQSRNIQAITKSGQLAAAMVLSCTD